MEYNKLKARIVNHKMKYKVGDTFKCNPDAEQYTNIKACIEDADVFKIAKLTTLEDVDCGHILFSKDVYKYPYVLSGGARVTESFFDACIQIEDTPEERKKVAKEVREKSKSLWRESMTGRTVEEIKKHKENIQKHVKFYCKKHLQEILNVMDELIKNNQDMENKK